MHRVFMAIVAMGATALAATAVAGPNWDAIHDAEAHGAHHTEEHVPPLDHGPRATSTPWLNKVHERCAAHKRATARHNR